MMKTKLFVLTVMLMPIMFGCSKNNRLDSNEQIIGSWRISFVEDYFNGEIQRDDYSAEEAWIFCTFYEDGSCREIIQDGPTLHDESDVSIYYFSWSMADGFLSIDGGAPVEIVFESSDEFYQASVGSKIGFKRMTCTKDLHLDGTYIGTKALVGSDEKEYVTVQVEAVSNVELKITIASDISFTEFYSLSGEDIIWYGNGTDASYYPRFSIYNGKLYYKYGESGGVYEIIAFKQGR